MGLYYIEEYLWKNPRGRGRPISGLKAFTELPWIESVACQRFFPSRGGRKWFKVLVVNNNRNSSRVLLIAPLYKR
jgi:hypothetical protein